MSNSPKENEVLDKKRDDINDVEQDDSIKLFDNNTALENENINEEVVNESKEEYLNLLEKIKGRVEQEKEESLESEDVITESINSNLELENTQLNDELEQTVVINKEELHKAIANSEINVNENTAVLGSAFAATTFANINVENNTQIFEEPKKEVVLEVLGLKKRIGLKTIVDDITFDMHAGEIIGLLGPNGSGKTTIMRMLVGLTKSSKGDVYCFEKPLKLGNTKMLAEVGSMIESPEFYNYMSGYANLKQIARLSTKKITRAKIKELLKFVGLEKVARKKVKTYSLGMRQRLGLAQALLHDPKILILDEPVNGLDPQGVKEFRDKLKEIAATGVSILISSHLLDEIEKVSDRIIVLEKGQIIADDTLENLCGEDIERTLLSTYDNDRAESLINDLDIPYDVTEEGFVFDNLSKDDKAKVVAYLVNNYVEINTIKVVRKTLEERFLEITGKGGLK